MLIYIGLETDWPCDRSLLPLELGKHYTQLKSSILVHRNVEPGIYPEFQLKVHYRIPAHLTRAELQTRYPKLVDFVWPCPVGRYHSGHYTVDVVFSKLPIDMSFSAQRSAPISTAWTPTERREWLSGHYGYWSNWTYDLRSEVVATTAMELLEQLPPEARTPARVVRHLTACLSEANFTCGLLHGMWDADRFHEGINPVLWESTRELLLRRREMQCPTKFAQCWIFSEVLVSLFRYLGLAARTVYVENARIDYGGDGGVDVMTAVTKDGQQRLVPYAREMIEAAVMGPLGTFENLAVPMGPEDVIPEDQLIVVKADLAEVDLKAYIMTGDGVWNFHLFPEVYLDGEWHCVDGCPLIETKSKDSYAGMKVLGPCPIPALKAGTPIEHDFAYFNSTVNGVHRYWRSASVVTTEGNVEVVYPYDIIAGVVGGMHGSRRQVKCYIRHPEYSIRSHMLPLNVTDDYQPPPETLYLLHHQLHPILFQWKGVERKLTLYLQHAISTMHYVQVCYLTSGLNVVSIDRQQVLSWDDYIPPVVPSPVAVVISVVIVNLTTREWWSQVV
jgi:hypothetical protein